MASSTATRGFPKPKYLTVSILAFVILCTAMEDSSSQITGGFEEQVVQPGNDVTIKCEAKGSPKSSINWFLDDQLLTESRRIRIYNKEIDNTRLSSELSISQISLLDGGLYTCANNNSRENGFSARINVVGQIGIREMADKTVVSGEKVKISCPYYGYPISEVIWLQGETSLPEHFRQTVKNGVLTIADVKKQADSGKYECVVVDKNGHQVEEQFNLNVMIPAKIMPFSFNEDLLREGMRARLQCVVSEGDPPINIQWTKDEKPISDDRGVIIRSLDEFSSILTINHVAPQHNGHFTCTASNPVSKVSHTARLNVNVSPKIFPFAFQDKYLSEGTQARVLCGLSQGDSPVRFQWLKDYSPVREDKGIIIRNVDNHSSILSIAIVSGEHSGNYTCLADNSIGSASYTAELVVNVPPKIVPFNFQEHHLLEGVLIRVSCVVSRGDLPLSITWLKDGQPIPAQLSVTTRDFDEYSSVLSIDPVGAKHNGNFTCVARNAAAAVNYTATLLVKELPKWIVKPFDASVHLGGPHLVHCEASGFPKPITTWFKIKGSRKTGDRERISSGPDFELLANGSLFIPSVKLFHQGYYLCLANNSIGTVSAMIQLTIKAPPEIITKTSSLTTKKGTALILKCEGMGDKPMIAIWRSLGQNLSSTVNNRYQIKQYDLNGTIISELKIHSTDRRDSTIFRCLISNAYGTDEATLNVTVLDSSDSPMKLKVLEITNRTAVVGWKVPFNGNSPITKYIMQIKQANDKWNPSTRNQTTPGQMLQGAITGLKPSMKYHVRVLAENAIGISQPSEMLEVVMAEAAPSSPPQGVVVIATDSNTLKTSWKPPAKEDWNGGIRGYYVGHKVAGSAGPYQFQLLEVPEDYIDTLSLPITNLQKFTQYSVVVQAFNDGGKGPLSKDILAVTSESVPTKPPTDVRCSVLTSQAVQVTWHQPPIASIHGILQGYKVIYRSLDDRTNMRPLTRTVNTTKTTLQGLEKFTNYSMQVLAFTRRGDGTKSSPVFCRTMEDIPDMPSDIKALAASSDKVVVVWKAPQHSNGVIVKYTVYSKRSNKKEDPKQYSASGNVTYLEILGLNFIEQYEHWVTASTTVGESPKSRVVTTTSVQDTIPGNIAGFNDELLINQGKDIQLHCRAVGKPLPEHSWSSEYQKMDENEHVQLLADGSIIIKDVRENDTGNYTCRVQNNYGKDQVTYSLIVQAVPGVMYIEVSLISTTSIDIQWKTGTTGGSPLTGFKLSYKLDDGDWSITDLEPSMTSYRLDGLHCGTKYHLTMAAYNKLGEGKSSSVITTSTKGGVPAPPVKEALIEESSIFVSLNLNSWTIDKCPVKYFVVEYKAFSSSQWIFFSDDIQPEKRKIIITDLVPATWYNLRMIAHSSAGTSVAEYTFATLTPEGGTINPQTVSDEGSARPIAFQLDIKHLIAAAASVLIVLLLGIIICICSRKSPSKKHKNKRGHSAFKGAPSECGSDSTYNTSYGYALGKGNIGTDPRRLQNSLGRNGDLSPYATAQLADHYPSHEMAALDLRNCVVGIGNHLPPGITIPFYPQGGVRPVSSNSGNMVPPMTSELINFRGQMPQFPMTMPYNGDALCHSNDARNVTPCAPPAPPLPTSNQNGLHRSSAGEIETTFVFPPPPQVSTPRDTGHGEQKYDAPWEGSLGSAAMNAQ